MCAMDLILPLVVGGTCAVLVLLGLRELLKEVMDATANKVG